VERLAENAKNIGRNWKKWSFAVILIFFRLFTLAMGWIQLKMEDLTESVRRTSLKGNLIIQMSITLIIHDHTCTCKVLE
jgi:hypothetical protein